MWRSCPSVCPSTCLWSFVQAAKLLTVGLLYKELSRGASFVKLNRHVTVTSIEGGKQISMYNFRISWPIVVKLSKEDLHAVPLSNCEFHENLWSESRTSRKGVNDILPAFFSLIDKWISVRTFTIYRPI